jgi:hypothetical protein
VVGWESPPPPPPKQTGEFPSYLTTQENSPLSIYLSTLSSSPLLSLSYIAALINATTNKQQQHPQTGISSPANLCVVCGCLSQQQRDAAKDAVSSQCCFLPAKLAAKKHHKILSRGDSERPLRHLHVASVRRRIP